MGQESGKQRAHLQACNTPRDSGRTAVTALPGSLESGAPPRAMRHGVRGAHRRSPATARQDHGMSLDQRGQRVSRMRCGACALPLPCFHSLTSGIVLTALNHMLGHAGRSLNTAPVHE